MDKIARIRQEVERLKEPHERNLDKPIERGRIGHAHGYVDCCDELLSFLDTLSEEHDKSLEEAIRLWVAGVFLAYTFPDTTVKTLREIVEKTFIAGAEWQKEQMMDEWLKDRDGCFWDGVAEGKKAMEKQMMKEAVEASVNTYELVPGGSAYVEFVADMPVARFRSNDKVRIVVLKAEEE